MGIDKARFKKPVTAGDTLRLEVTLQRYVRGIWKFWTEARVDDKVVTEAELMCTVRSLKDA
ncbi:3-hydroxyacyl-[acyl-carrier-protein] dehydratase FabZ [compost metagenome]